MQFSTAIENYAARLLGIESPSLIFDSRFQTQVAVDIQKPLHQLADAAITAGFNLQIASHYRNFDRQLFIWNEKAAGRREVLGDDGRAIDLNNLSDAEKVYAILRWSALPGASRHHWGTDLDVFDAAAMPDNYRVQLTLEETQTGGVFANFHAWLSDYFATTPCDFYRPYQSGIGSVAEEPWHLSYAPLAQEFSSRLTESLLSNQIKKSNIELKTSILECMPDIFNKYLRPYQ